MRFCFDEAQPRSGREANGNRYGGPKVQESAEEFQQFILRRGRRTNVVAPASQTAADTPVGALGHASAALAT